MMVGLICRLLSVLVVEDEDVGVDDGGVSDNAIPSGLFFGIVRNIDTIFE